MNKTLVLTLIVLSQFFGTSLWFSSNAVLVNIAKAHHLQSPDLLANLTIATQLGFIIGSLFYAFFCITDRFYANRVFSISILLGAISNAAILLPNLTFGSLFFFRLLTGIFLAGVYPVGMKIAAYFFPKKVSNALGILVGALVLGTAFPYFVTGFNLSISWQTVIIFSSTLATLGGVMMLFLHTPPKAHIQRIEFGILPKLFAEKNFRTASYAYFGHMWELYTFWAFVPLLIGTYISEKNLSINSSFWSFVVISSGALGCVIVGKLALKKNILTVTKWIMYTSAVCCLFTPFSFFLPKTLFFSYLIIWGMSVVADSPLLSSLINKNSLKNYNGTALTLSTSFGFIITIFSISLFNYLLEFIEIKNVFLILFIGPFLGVLALIKKKN